MKFLITMVLALPILLQPFAPQLVGVNGDFETWTDSTTPGAPWACSGVCTQDAGHSGYGATLAPGAVLTASYAVPDGTAWRLNLWAMLPAGTGQFVQWGITDTATGTTKTGRMSWSGQNGRWLSFSGGSPSLIQGPKQIVLTLTSLSQEVFTIDDVEWIAVVLPTVTPTATSSPTEVLPTVVATHTPTATEAPPTATSSPTEALPTVVATHTPTATEVLPTATSTATSTPTATEVLPTATSTATSTPTATGVPVPTATFRLYLPYTNR